MQFLWTAAYVRDMDESVTFYTELLDLKVTKRFQAGSQMEIAFLGNGRDGETLIELLSDNHRSEVAHSEFLSVGFAVESIEAMMETVERKGISLHSGPFETPGSKYFTIKDPNGLQVQFFQQK